MYKYRINIKKVSGRLNESVLPSKNLVIKSKTKKTDNEVFAEAFKYFKKKYGLVIESADISTDGSNINDDYKFVSDVYNNAAMGTVESRIATTTFHKAQTQMSNYISPMRYIENNPNGEMVEDARNEMKIAEQKMQKIRIELQKQLEKYKEILHLSYLTAERIGIKI